jgi:hypothetical protein
LIGLINGVYLSLAPQVHPLISQVTGGDDLPFPFSLGMNGFSR